MFCVFLELPYERQLHRINETILNSFIDLIKHEAKDNGGVFFDCQNAYGFCFKKDCIAYAYSVSRFLFNSYKIFTSHIEKISEVRFIVDYYSDSFHTQKMQELFLNYKQKLIPEQGIFVTSKVKPKLAKYLTFKYAKCGLFECTKFKFFDDTDKKKSIENEKSIIVHKNDNYLWSVYNFMLSNPIDDIIKNKVSETDRKTFYSTKNSYLYLKKYRFSKELPNYFIDAFLLNASIYFKTYKKYINKHKLIKIMVDSTDDLKNVEEAEKILFANKSMQIENLNNDIPSIDNIPDDILELIYIIINAGKYFFYDELNDFLLSLNKSKSFFYDVYFWMYSAGIISDVNNIYAFVYDLLELIEKRIGFAKINLDGYISNYLWKKYKVGLLIANKDSEAVFNYLKFQYKPDFLITSIFHNYTDSEIKNLDLTNYKNHIFFDALNNYKIALNLQTDIEIKKAYTWTKNTIIFFQDHKLNSGEYKAFSYLAFLNLAENKISDALMYFSYALDNAEYTRDTSFICEALFNISIAYFLQNNLTQSITFLDKLSNSINEYFEQDWKIPCLFLQGRIYLQIGEFKKAEEVLNIAADFASMYFTYLESVCRVWAARAMVYNGQRKKAQHIFLDNIDCTEDSILFLLESIVIFKFTHGDFEDFALDYEGVYNNAKQVFLIDFKNINSGFNIAEDLIWSRLYSMPVGKKMFNALYNYYKYKTHYLKSDYRDKCKINLLELESFAIEALYHNDSFSSIYLYLCYDIYLNTYGETSSQTTAYLSKAFKAMQKNVLNISENDIRDKFMQKNFWNAKLFKVAQASKLI